MQQNLQGNGSLLYRHKDMKKFKDDENLPVETTSLFREAGHGAVTVVEQDLGGRGDPDTATVCQSEGYTLVTLDTDFADIRMYPPRDYSGLIVLRLRRQDKPHVLKVLGQMIHMLSIEPLDRHLWLVNEWQIRIRG
jgi:predicted nuclease of predicted toxin-antitoxin system